MPDQEPASEVAQLIHPVAEAHHQAVIAMGGADPDRPGGAKWARYDGCLVPSHHVG